MRHWLTQIVVIAGGLLFVAKLPALGSLTAALLAACLAVATVTALCATVDLLDADGLAGEHPGSGTIPYRAP